MRGAKLLLGVTAVLALLGAGSQSAGAGSAERPKVVVSRGALSDLSTATADPTDGASGAAIAISAHGQTRVMMLLWGLDRTQAGIAHGAHVHVGPCVAGSGGSAGPHYNATGGVSVDASAEVWLDFTITSFGFGFASSTVPFVIPAGGARSIVIHAAPTAPNGTAGPRLACLPMEF